MSEMLQAAFEHEGCRVVDGTLIVRETRSVKSLAEVACIEIAVRIAGAGLEVAKAAL